MHHTRGLFVSLACVLVGFGVLMVYSASITSWPTEFEQVYLSRHVIFVLIGVAAAAVCARLPESFWSRAAPWLFVATVALLVVVLVPGLGARVKGAQRWLRFGPLSLQPSELAKIALPLLVCRLACGRRPRDPAGIGQLSGPPEASAASREGEAPVGDQPPLRSMRPEWFRTALILFCIGSSAGLVIVQPDLGTALFLALGAAIALFAAGWPIRNFFLAAAVAAPACAFLVAVKPYQLDRVTGFLAAWSDWSQAPYQMKQSLVTLGAGGLFGAGLGKGWQKLSFLPEANTDFVFAVVGEELGLVGTLGLVAVWIALYLTGLRLLRPLPAGGFAQTAGFTLLTQLVLQAALNVAVVTAMVPPKGIPHPLLSYGGSNLVVSIVSLGIVLGLSRRADGAHDAHGAKEA